MLPVHETDPIDDSHVVDAEPGRIATTERRARGPCNGETTDHEHDATMNAATTAAATRMGYYRRRANGNVTARSMTARAGGRLDATPIVLKDEVPWPGRHSRLIKKLPLADDISLPRAQSHGEATSEGISHGNNRNSTAVETIR
jgi:hypothetical protein